MMVIYFRNKVIKDGQKIIVGIEVVDLVFKMVLKKVVCQVFMKLVLICYLSRPFVLPFECGNLKLNFI